MRPLHSRTLLLPFGLLILPAAARASTLLQHAYVKASNTDSIDQFGASVAVSGGYFVVGAPSEASNATGVNGNQLDSSAVDAGAAYVFENRGAGWAQQAYLKASNTAAHDHFGWAVAISGDTLAVGAPTESGQAGFSGAVYVFVRNGANWSQQAYLKASNAGASDLFGGALALEGDTLIVGAREEDSSATGSNGNELDNSASSSGAAYVFTRSGTSWSQQAYLKASNTDPFDGFGGSLALEGQRLVAGAPFEASHAVGIDGDATDNSLANSGAAYVFARSAGTWNQQAYVKASNTDLGDLFACALALSGVTLIAGAALEDGSATGINGNQLDNFAAEAGAVYALEFASGIAPLCFGDGSIMPCPCSNPSGAGGRGCDNSAGTGGAILLGSGVPSLAADTLFLATGSELPNATSIVLQGSSVTSGGLVFGQGLRCVSGTLKRLYVESASAGSIFVPGPGDPSISARSAALGDPIGATQPRYYMVYYRDPVVLGSCAPTSTFNATNALAVSWEL